MSDDMKIDPESIYTISTAARLLSVSPSTLRDLERRRKLECTRTPGGQRRFVGSELLRMREESMAAPPRKPGPTSSSGTANTADAKARRAWLGSLIARAQRELPVDTPIEIRVRLGADLERALRNLGPASPIGDVEPLVKSLVERARLQAQEAEEEAQRRETKDQLLEYALTHLRRSIDTLPRRMAGPPGSPKRRHIRATLRDQLRDRLRKRLTGDEAWHEVRELVEEFVAAWYVEQTRDPLMPHAVKLLAAGATGVVGGAAAAIALSPEIRARAAKLKERLRLKALDLLKRFTTSPASASSSPNPTNQTTKSPPCRLSTGLVGVWPVAYRRTSKLFRPATPQSQDAAAEGPTGSDAQATDAPTTDRDTAPQESPGAPSPTS